MMRGCTHAEARENTVNAGTANALRRRCAAAPAGARGGGPGNARGAAAAGGRGGGDIKNRAGEGVFPCEYRAMRAMTTICVCALSWSYTYFCVLMQ
jgi:hypothetical protein